MIHVSFKDRKQMIKCNVTVCGIISRDASIRMNTEGKEFLTFPLRITIPATDGQSMNIEVSVRKEGERSETDGFRNGSRIEARGTMYFKRRGDKLYLNLFADEICKASEDNVDAIKGELVFRGKVGQRIEDKRDKKDKPYTVFSAFSAEKVADGFEYQWVRFFCFGYEREKWLQAGVKVDVRGEMNLCGRPQYTGPLQGAAGGTETGSCSSGSCDHSKRQGLWACTEEPFRIPRNRSL